MIDENNLNHRAILVRSKARAFSRLVKADYGYAYRIPDDIFDWLRDEEIPTFMEYLKRFGLRRREQDGKWEEDR